MASKAIGFLNFKFGADLSGFQRALKKAQKGLKKFGKWAQKTGQNLSRNLTLPIIGLGAASIKTFATFEQGMLKVKAISGATDSEFKALTESAKELGSTTMFTASQVAELQLNLSKLGFDPQSILDSSQAILNLAQATDSDLGEAATVAASTMNAFGLEAKDMTMISDVMADSFSSSALDLQKFQTAMASVAPVANQAGADIQRTSAILGVLVNNGIEASSAGTALRNVFLELANKGLTWDEAMIKIQTSMNPLKTAMDLFGKRGSAVATIIANNGAEIQALTDDFNDSAGEAQKMADIMDSGVGGAMRKLQSQTEGLLIQLGTALMPIFKKILDRLSSLVTWFSSLSDSQKDNIVFWGLIVAAIGPVLIIFGKVATGVAALIPIFVAIGGVIMSTVVPAFVALWAVMVANPLGAILGTLGLLAAGITALVLSNDDATDSTIKLTESQKKLQAELEETARVERSLAFMRNDKAAQETYIAERRLMFKEKLANANTKEEKQLAKAQIQLTDLRNNVAFWGESLKNTLDQEGYDISLEYYKDAQKAVEDQIDVVGKLQKLVTKKLLVNGNKEIVEETKMYSDALDTVSTNMLFMASSAEDQFKGILTWTQTLTKAQEAHNATVVLLEDIMFSAAMSAANSQQKFFDSFIENIKQAIKQLLIQLAVLTVIAILLGGPTMTIGKAFGIAKGKILGLEGFADGGLVYGPTTALIGEGVGTTASNPEVVAPLDKLKQHMGGGNQNIIVEGVLKGNDIYLSNRNTSVNRLRTT